MRLKNRHLRETLQGRDLDSRQTGGRRLFLMEVLLILLLDQYGKYAVTSTMALGETLPLIPDFFHLTLIMNRGVSFGMLQNMDLTWFFIWLTGLVVILIFCLVFFWPGADRLSRIFLGIIAGGALGNLADRLRFGAVVDFIDFRGIWPYIFNIADMAVVCGGIAWALVLAYQEWRTAVRARKH